MLLAQMQVDIGSRATSLLPKVVPSLLIILGAFIWGYPQDNPNWAPWSRAMNRIGAASTPGGTEVSRYWVSVGITTLTVGIFFSRNARRFLTSPIFNFLGRVSFPVYLLHNTLIRTVMVWLAYGQNASKLPYKTAEGNVIQVGRASPASFFVIIPCFYAILYAVGYLWTIYVDPLCARIVSWITSKMFIEQQKPQEKPIPLTNVA